MGGGGSIPMGPRVLVRFQMGSGITIPSLDPRMGRWSK